MKVTLERQEWDTMGNRARRRRGKTEKGPEKGGEDDEGGRGG